MADDKGSGDRAFRWDWAGENPAELTLLVFVIIAFFFFHSLPPQGWGIDDTEPPAPTARAGK